MKKALTLLLLISLTTFHSFAQKIDNDSINQVEEIQKIIERDKQIVYQTGKLDLNSEVQLTVPKGYKFMSKKDSEFVVFDFWGNPRYDGLLGMIVKEDYTLLDAEAWAFIVTYENSGYVKDEDANDIDYDDMMDELKSDEADNNEARVKEGYPPIHMIGWAAKPYYDKNNNILHWAKSMVFGETPVDTTLNYDVRILGRKGVLSLNAVGNTHQLGDIKAHIPDIIHIAKFKEGSKYMDFNPDIDQVAAYSIGGLVAGKLLAKAGILALLLKNIKLIAFALIAFFGKFGKKIVGLFSSKKAKETPPATPDETTTDEQA